MNYILVLVLVLGGSTAVVGVLFNVHNKSINFYHISCCCCRLCLAGYIEARLYVFMEEEYLETQKNSVCQSSSSHQTREESG